jgi:hypothetical protein
MDDFELSKLIEQIVFRLKNGEQVEENKLELKSVWYNFSDQGQRKKAESEFLKDICAIANTPGPTGYLIIGINEKNGQVKNSPFSECNLREITELRNLIVKKVDRPIDFEFKEIKIKVELEDIIFSVFMIPPSLEKPHIIGLYISSTDKETQNFIPVKKNTAIYPANRSDIEFMYYDRKNVEPEYAMDILTYNPLISLSGTRDDFNMSFQLCLQNYGRKPITIVKLDLIVLNKSSDKLFDEVIGSLYTYKLDASINSKEYYFTQNYIVVPSNNSIILRPKFNFRDSNSLVSNYLRNRKNNYSLALKAKDIFLKEYEYEIKNYSIG